MNYTSEFTSNFSALYSFAKKIGSKVIPDQNSVSGKIVEKTTEVAKGVFLGVLPHLINMAPWYLSRMTNVRVLGWVGLKCSEWCQFKRLVDEPSKGFLDTTLKCAFYLSAVYADLDTVGRLGFSPESSVRIGVETFLIITTAIASACALKEGADRMYSSWNTEGTSTTVKVSDFVSGVILTTLGTRGIVNSFHAGENLTNGFIKFQTLDLMQKKSVLQFRAIKTLGGEKSCKAVVFFDSEIKTAFPFTEFLYENCDVLGYEVKDSGQFCGALKDAKNRLGGSIPVFVTQGHADNLAQTLHKDYHFLGNPQELNCMNDALSSDAQIFLQGCNTATSLSFSQHIEFLSKGLVLSDDEAVLINRVSNGLKGREVNGFAAYYSPGFTTSSFINHRFQHDNHFPWSLHGINSPFSTVVTKKS